MTRLKVSMLFKAVSVMVLIFMVSAVVSSMLLSPTVVNAASDEKGLRYYNSNSTKYICVCDQVTTQYCTPCMDILPE